MSKNRRSFFRMLRTTFNEQHSKGNSESVEQLSEVIEFVKEGTWTGVRNWPEFYSTVYENPREAAETLGITAASYRSKVKDVSDRLYSLFGDDFFVLFDLADSVEHVKTRIYSVSNAKKSVDVVPVMITRHVRGGAAGTYKLEECIEEARLLARYSMTAVEGELAVLDLSKVRYLLSILDRRRGTFEEQEALLRYVEEGKHVEDVTTPTYRASVSGSDAFGAVING